MKSNLFLSSKDLIEICPILLYHATAQTSLERSGCIDSQLIDSIDFHVNGVVEKEDRALGK